MDFLAKTVSKNRSVLCDQVSDNFHVINPNEFRVLS